MRNAAQTRSIWFAVIFLALRLPLLAQNFPPPGSLNEFSDVMADQPDTAMVIDSSDVPVVQPEPDYPGTPATVEPELPDTTVNYEGPIGVTGVIDNVTTGCSYSPLSHSGLRAIDDIVVAGSVGKYPLKMTRYYNSRSWYWDFTRGLSPGWSHEYSWLLWTTGHKVVSPQGNVYDNYCGAPVGASEGWDDGNQSVPHNVGIWRLADGGRVHLSGGMADYIEDPYGLRTIIARDGSNRVSKVTEPGGRYLQFTYGTTAAYTDPAWGNKLLQKVEAWDGQGHLIETVNYTYTNVDSGGIDPITNQHIIRKMLTGVAYDDSTSASYTYRIDNVPDHPLTPPYTIKLAPLLETANDKRYNGPMRQIFYQYDDGGPHGAIQKEKKDNVNGVLVSHIEGDIPLGGWGPMPEQFTETRGDGPTRTFTYTPFMVHQQSHDPTEYDPCLDAENNSPPQQMLTDYTDFYTPGSQGHTTHIGYDAATWYITSVTDANGNTTTYERGNSPSHDGIGEIKKITHPGGSHIQYGYQSETGALDGHYITSIEDENGKLTSITRDAKHRITEIDYPQGSNTPASFETFIYCDQADSQCNNIFGQVKRHRLKNGAYVHYKYDSRGLLTDKWEPTWTDSAVEAEAKTHYDYYASGRWTDRVKTMTMPPNFPFSYSASETYEYDVESHGNRVAGRGLITKITYVNATSGISRSFRYDQYGNKVDEWNELDEITHYIYDNYNRLTSVSRGGETTSYSYNPTNGGTSPYLHTTNNPDMITSPTGIATNNVYDANFRKTSTSVAGGTPTWFHYDVVGNLQCVTDPRGSGECPSPSTQCAYTTRTDYDSRNRKWHIWDAQNHQTTFTYDSASNITRIDRPNGNWEQKAYDAVNRVIRDTVSFAAGTSLETWFVYNPSGTIQKVVDPRGTVGWAYPNGDPNFTTTFVYSDPADKRTAMWYPGNSDVQRWGYDQAHNLIWHAFPSGAKAFAYDQRNRKYAELWNLDDDYRWYYFGLDDVSRVRDAKNGSGYTGNGGFDYGKMLAKVHREYYHTGKLKLDTQTILDLPDGPGLEAKTVNYDYETQYLGAETTPTHMWVTKPDGSSANYDYNFRCDDMGRFEKILGPNLGLMFQYSYDLASNEMLRHNEANGVDQSYNPDELNRRGKTDVLYKNAQGNNAHAVETYGYWENGRLHTVTRGNKQDQFTYYLDGELKQAMYGVLQSEGISTEPPPAEDPTKQKTVDDFLAMSGFEPNGVLTADRTVAYNLDNAGNRVSVNDSQNGLVTYSPNNLNEYVDRVGSDAIGNGTNHEVTSYKNVAYTYKDEHLTNVISGANSYNLAYDALGRCVKRIMDGVTKYYIYDGERPILEYGIASNLRGKNLYGKGIDEILMRYDPTLSENQTYYYQQDHQGSVIYLTKPDGKLLEKYRYDVFGTPTIRDGDGNLLPNGSAVSNRFMFTGREYAAAFKFYEYRARAYHPGLGRFMSEDPKLFVHSAVFGKVPDDWTFGAHPDEAEFNLFRYCGNDPIDFSDPMGLEVGFGESLIPVWGSAHMAYDSYNEGHYGMAAFHTLMAATDVSGIKAVGSILGKTGIKMAGKVIAERTAIRAAERAAAEKEGGLVIGKIQDLEKATGWRKGDFTLNLPKLPPGPERWAQNARELQYYINKGKPIRDVSPKQAGGFLDRERALLRENGWKYDPKTQLWRPGR